METFPALLAHCVGNSPVTGEFPSQRPVMWSFDVFLDLWLNEQFSKQSWGWWFETPTRSLWRHCNAIFDVTGTKVNWSDISRFYNRVGFDTKCKICLTPFDIFATRYTINMGILWRHFEHIDYQSMQWCVCLLSQKKQHWCPHCSLQGLILKTFDCIFLPKIYLKGNSHPAPKPTVD